ncbi:class III lanthipeptide [Streptomyces sp. NPDC004327]
MSSVLKLQNIEATVSTIAGLSSCTSSASNCCNKDTSEPQPE